MNREATRNLFDLLLTEIQTNGANIGVLAGQLEQHILENFTVQRYFTFADNQDMRWDLNDSQTVHLMYMILFRSLEGNDPNLIISSTSPLYDWVLHSGEAPTYSTRVRKQRPRKSKLVKPPKAVSYRPKGIPWYNPKLGKDA